ncbi:mechanosensitive ion channel family protein [Fibrobacterota bacterium]
MKTIPLELGHITLTSFLMFVFAVAGTLMIGNGISSLIMNIFRDRIGKTYLKIIAKIVMYAVYFTGISLSLSKIIKFNLPAALAALGVFGAFCFVPTIPIMQNAIAGIFLAFIRPFREEDLIDVGGELCEVLDIMILKTKLRGRDGKIILLPNLAFITGNIINYSRGKFLQASLSFDFKAAKSFEELRELLLRICSASPDILPNPPARKAGRLEKYFQETEAMERYQPQCLVNGLGHEKISVELRFWIWDIRRREEIIHDFYLELDRDLKEGLAELV